MQNARFTVPMHVSDAPASMRALAVELNIAVTFASSEAADAALECTGYLTYAPQNGMCSSNTPHPGGSEGSKRGVGDGVATGTFTLMALLYQLTLPEMVLPPDASEARHVGSVRALA